MKLLKITCVIFFLLALFQLYLLWNLRLSYKYEVDLMKTHVNVSTESQEEKHIKLRQIEIREKEIIGQQNVSKVLLPVFIGGSIISIFLLIKIKY